MQSYKIIQVDGMLLAVDKDKFQSSWLVTTNNNEDWKAKICKRIVMEQTIIYEAPNSGPFSFERTGFDKIIAYNPLSTGKTLEGLPLLPDLQDNVDKAINDIETCLYEAPVDFVGTGSNWKAAAKEEKAWMKKGEDSITIIRGYKAAGKFSIEDIQKAYTKGWEDQRLALNNHNEDYIQSLTKYPTSIEVDDSLPVDQMFKQGKYDTY